MIDLKQLTGVMNLDDPNDVLPPFHHKFLMNGRFRGNGNNMRVESVPGNSLIPNYTLPTGTNQQNGGFYDSVKRRIIWWNYNSNGRNGIYKYDVGTKVLSKVFLCFTDSATDVLGLSLDYPIHSASIVYRTEADGDLLFWTNGLGRPMFINLDTVSAMQPFTTDMLYVAKNVPLTPLVCSYQDDAAVNVNNLRKKLFRFAQRWVYKNLEKSVISTISKVPLPVNGYDPNIDNDATLNNNILVPIYAGGNDCKAIELLMQYNEVDEKGNNLWTDFLSVATFDLDDYNILPGATYNFNFYNNSDYVPVDPLDMALYYDWIPDVAQTMEVLNGNHIIYANTTDGYNGLTRAEIDVTLSTGLSTPNTPSISIVQTTANAAQVIVGATILVGTTYHVQFDYTSSLGSGTKTVNYVTVGGDTQLSIQNHLVTLLNVPPIISTPVGGGVLNVIVDGFTPVMNNPAASVSASGAENASPSFKWSCPERFGIQYLDQWDKPVGGVYSFVSDDALDTTDFSATTPDFSTLSNVPQIPFIAMTINHTPPVGAVSYHIVRAELTPKFIYWVTNDYQTDATYLYVCIQNLYFQNTQNTGFVPTYDFAKGDRLRMVASFNEVTGFYTPYSLQLDFEILGTVQKTMTSPASIGTFLKLRKPTTFPSAAYQAKMLVDIYTPKANTPSDLLVFKEWGEKYDIYTSANVRYHRGQVTDQTASQPATFHWFDGDVYYKSRTFFLDAISSSVQSTAFMMDKNYNDYFPSAVNSNGRGWIIQPDARVITNGVEIRWGGGYLQDTNINELNRFRPENIDALDLSKGNILRILAEKRLVYFYHSRAVGSVGVYSRYIKNNQNQQELISTDELITKNNIYYLQGNYGLQNQPCAVFRGDGDVHYFIDCTNGSQLRRSGDGITNLGDLYWGQYTISDLLTPYNSNYLRADGSKAKIMGFFDTFEGQAHFILQGGTYSGITIPSYNFSFNEARNGYNGFYDYANIDWALSAASITYAWKNGQLYVHNDEVKRCNFFGVQYYPSITLVFNKDSGIIKLMNSIGYQSEGKIWVSSELSSFSKGENIDAIVTSTVNQQTGFRQSSRLKDFNYSIENYKTTAALLRDINSGPNGLLALNELDYLTGSWIEIKFTYKGSDYVFMWEPYLNYEVSNRNF